MVTFDSYVNLIGILYKYGVMNVYQYESLVSKVGTGLGVGHTWMYEELLNITDQVDAKNIIPPSSSKEVVLSMLDKEQKLVERNQILLKALEKISQLENNESACFEAIKISLNAIQEEKVLLGEDKK